MNLNSKITKPLRDEVKPIIVQQGGTSCFAPETLVATDLGLKKIKDIMPGDCVLSHSVNRGIDEYRRVINVMRFDNHKKTIRVRLKSGKTITATEDHKFYYEGGWHSLKHILSLLNTKK